MWIVAILVALAFVSFMISAACYTYVPPPGPPPPRRDWR